MNKPLVIEPEAVSDLGVAFDWYEAQRTGLGADFLLCVEAALEAIARASKIFSKSRQAHPQNPDQALSVFNSIRRTA